MTDLLFALDSIPAIYGLTKEPYLVFTANMFALMGLRQLYFLIGDLLKRLVYLSYGLAFLLAFIGVKLILHALHENELPFINGGEHIEWAPEIPIWALAGRDRRHPRRDDGAEPGQGPPRPRQGRPRVLAWGSMRLGALLAGPDVVRRGAGACGAAPRRRGRHRHARRPARRRPVVAAVGGGRHHHLRLRPGPGHAS